MSMKRLILDRLIETTEQAWKAKTADAETRASQAESLLHSLRTEFASANQRLTQAVSELALQRDKVREFQKQRSEADVPLTELFRAAENMMKARTIGQYNAARPRLDRALSASEKYIDQIPF